MTREYTMAEKTDECIMQKSQIPEWLYNTGEIPLSEGITLSHQCYPSSELFAFCLSVLSASVNKTRMANNQYYSSRPFVNVPLMPIDSELVLVVSISSVPMKLHPFIRVLSIYSSWIIQKTIVWKK